MDSVCKFIGVAFCHLSVATLNLAVLMTFVARVQCAELIASRGDGSRLLKWSAHCAACGTYKTKGTAVNVIGREAIGLCKLDHFTLAPVCTTARPLYGDVAMIMVTSLGNNLKVVPQLLEDRLCLRIFLWVLGPNRQFSCCHDDPPVHGSAPKSRTSKSGSDTAASAFANPESVVRSSVRVRRTTSQSGGANLPIRELGPQQNSTIRRLRGVAASEAPGREPPTRVLGALGVLSLQHSACAKDGRTTAESGGAGESPSLLLLLSASDSASNDA